MKNTATLGQTQKIMSFLEGIPSEQIQISIESGILSDAIREQGQKNRVSGMWEMIMSLTGGTGISITVPHGPSEFAHGANKFQLRCWFSGNEHIDSSYGNVFRYNSNLLFEIHLPEKLSSRWYEELRAVGMDFRGNTRWLIEDKGNYNIVFNRQQ